MEMWQGKHFSITDPKNVSTVIYQINKTEKQAKGGPKFTVERLKSTSELRGENSKRTYYVDSLTENNNQILILSFGKDRVVINNGILEDDKIRISKKPMPFKFDTIYSEETVYKEFSYTPNLKRPISIIDLDTTEEIKPLVYFDEKTNEVKGKCKLKANKQYFAFEVREKNDNFELLGGVPVIT